MRIFVSGGTGVIGWRTVRELGAAGHEVTALVRSDEKAALIERLGARPVRVSLFDPEPLTRAVAGSEVVINLATSLPSLSRVMFSSAWRANDRVRSEGSRNLVDAALAAGAFRYIQESVVFVYAGGEDGRWLDENSEVTTTRIAASVLDAEASAGRFTQAGGIGVVLRFGAFYGPDSEHTLLQMRLARVGLNPLPGKGQDYVSSISTDDAASAVVAALEVPAGLYNIVDDAPITRDRYDLALAEALGVRRVRRPWMPLGTMEHVARSHRVSNRKVRSATDWAPRYPSVTDALDDLVDQTVGRVAPGGRRLRVILGLMTAGALFLGVWAQFGPFSFFDSFPGWGRGWGLPGRGI